MPLSKAFRPLLTAGLVLLAAPAGAQIFELVGTRAQGMAGAFVAVADDATATWWNPAGIATGPYFSGLFQRGLTDDPAEAVPGSPRWRGETTAVAFVFPALGLSYYRLRINEIASLATTADGGPGRQDQGAVGLRSLAIRQFGVTVGQSAGDHLVIASTLRLVRGGLAVSADPVTGNPLDAANDLDVSTETETDLDLGAMLSFGPARGGLAVKHVGEPLQRQARLGLAFLALPSGAPNTVTFAVDADLTKTATALGDAQHVAAGVEAWVLRRRIGLRGGLSANRVGEARTSTSVGASLAARAGLYLEGALTLGSDQTRKGWTVGLGVTY
jgi:hypothetical protein